MKSIKKAKDPKMPIIKIDKSLDRYDDVVLFPEKLAKANEMLKRTGITEEWLKRPH